MDGPIVMIVRVIALFLLIWFGAVNATKFFRGHPISSGSFALMSAAAVALAWSMGWLW